MLLAAQIINPKLLVQKYAHSICILFSLTTIYVYVYLCTYSILLCMSVSLIIVKNMQLEIVSLIQKYWFIIIHQQLKQVMIIFLIFFWLSEIVSIWHFWNYKSQALLMPFSINGGIPKDSVKLRIVMWLVLLKWLFLSRSYVDFSILL